MTQPPSPARSASPSAPRPRPLITRLLGSSRSLIVHTELLSALQSSAYEDGGELFFPSHVLYVGLFIEQLAYWHDRMEADWVYNTRGQWAEQLFISDKDFRTLYEWTRAMGLVHSEVRRVRLWMPEKQTYQATTISHYRLNFDLLARLLQESGVEVPRAYAPRSRRSPGESVTRPGLGVSDAQADLMRGGTAGDIGAFSGPVPELPLGQSSTVPGIAPRAIPIPIHSSTLIDSSVCDAHEAALNGENPPEAATPIPVKLTAPPGAAAPTPNGGAPFSPRNETHPGEVDLSAVGLENFPGGAAAAEREMLARMAANVGVSLRMSEPEFARAYDAYQGTMRERGRYNLPSQGHLQLEVFAQAWKALGREDFLDVVNTMTAESKDVGYLKGAIRKAEQAKTDPPRQPGSPKPGKGKGKTDKPVKVRPGGSNADIEISSI